MEEIPNVKPRENEPPAYFYEEGKKLGLNLAKGAIDKHLADIQAARDWSADLSYPYPESHAIWLGEEKVCKLLLEEINEM